MNRRRALRSMTLVVSAASLLAAGLVDPPATVAASNDCETVSPDGPCGMNLEAAWDTYTTGDPSVVVSYIEGGINWHVDSARDLTEAIYVNWHEVPVPCGGGACATTFSSRFADYDRDGDGRANAAEWANDPRVHDSNENGYVDAEDLIVAFSDGIDQDRDGYTDDISGWDFYDDQNDPGTVDSAYEHANNQMLRLRHECPRCSVLPVKGGEEALDNTDDLAKAWLFSGDVGASVIVSVTADLGYSSFMRQTVRHLADRGIVMVEASNDFDSMDHQGGMFWPYVLPGNGVVRTADGRAWVRSNYTSWGTHNVFSVTTNGGTTSESTPTLGGVVALLLSWGREAARRGLIDRPLSGPEAVQVMRATARQVTGRSLPWPGSPGEWTPQYGYGIPDLYEAMRFVAERRIPAAARIDSPDWYTPFDPKTARAVQVSGTIQAPRASSFTWKLQAGLGPDPDDDEWFEIGHGSGAGWYRGRLGTLDLSRIPRERWTRPYAMSDRKDLETTERYTVTLRLVVIDSNGRRSKDRRAINVLHDPSWLTGFPMQLGVSGESQPALVDLQGTGRLAMVFGDADGVVHAIDPETRQELPGWPAHTHPVRVLVRHEGVDPGHEPIISNVAVGDLRHNGELSVVVTSLGGHVYVFDARGRLRPGWPKVLDRGVQRPAIPRPALPFTRLPVRGATAPPVLFDLDGDRTLEIIQAGWNGFIHAWHPEGTNLQGWPVDVQMPADFRPAPGYVLVNDHKLDTPPAIAYLHGRAEQPFVVERVQYTETRGDGIQPAPFGYTFAYGVDGSVAPGWPVRMPGTVEYYGSAQEFITEGNAAPVAADVTGSRLGPDFVAVGPVLSPPYLIDGTGQIVSAYQSPTEEGDPPVSFTTWGAFGKLGGAMSFALAETGGASTAQALLEPNSGVPIKNYEVAYPATGGGPRPGFPADRQGIDFLGQPVIADVTGDGLADLVDGGDSCAIHGYDSTGRMPSRFPRWTTGWNLYAPPVADLDGDGKVELVSVTREGYLFVWRTNGLTTANTEWWRAQHDEWNTGNYEAQTRPPGAVLDATWSPGSPTLSFTAPGAVWYAGSPTEYVVRFGEGGLPQRVPATVPAGSIQTIAVPPGTTSIVIQAVNAAGLLGTPVSIP